MKILISKDNVCRELHKFGATEHEYYMEQTIARIGNSTREIDKDLLQRLIDLVSTMLLSGPSDFYFFVKNALSIAAVPAEHITDFDRDDYINLAETGHDVYAYNSGPNAWYLWYFDTRVPLPPLTDIVWKIIAAVPRDGNVWRLTFEHKQIKQQIDIHVTIPAIMTDTDNSVYHRRINRVLKALVGDIAKWHYHPSSFNTCTFTGA